MGSFAVGAIVAWAIFSMSGLGKTLNIHPIIIGIVGGVTGVFLASLLGRKR